MTATPALADPTAPHDAAATPRMKTLAFELKFLTPAFLGDAEQSGRWRTPPFKAQLRQWWRVVYAADRQFKPEVAAMRRDEGFLFGNAWLDDNFCKSLVRMRLDRWDGGNLKSTQWPRLETTTHEVQQAVASDLYLGYGPVTLPRGAQRPTLKANAAIQAGESATFSLALPADLAKGIERALWLMDRFGTVGGRSRNGWGSYSLLPLPPGEGWGEGITPPLRDWKACLGLDWPHAIGKDGQGPLIWQTAPHADWQALMQTLADIKIGLRTQFRFTTGHGAPNPGPRHWLAYPVTNHSVGPWGNNARLPNQLRFKAQATADGRLVGVIFHMPHLPPPAFRPDRDRDHAAIERVWQQVHAFLDDPAQKLNRIKD